MRETEPSTNEREFVLAALKEGARIDGRKFYDFRTLRLSFGSDYGAVEVQLGNTRSETASMDGLKDHTTMEVGALFTHTP